MDSPIIEGSNSSFIKIRGVRWLVKEAVDALEPDHRREVLISANKIAEILDSSNEEAEIKDDILPSRESAEHLFNRKFKSI